jgi:hypothetical protein
VINALVAIAPIVGSGAGILAVFFNERPADGDHKGSRRGPSPFGESESAPAMGLTGFGTAFPLTIGRGFYAAFALLL